MVETTLRKTPDSKHKIELHSIAPEPPITVGGSWDFKKSGVIARGAKWEFAPPDLNVDAMPYELNEVQFVDASNGWICGDRGYVLRSTDGGATWQQKRYGRIYDHLHGIAFTDATHGCIAGATGVSYTGDAGEHWTKGAEGDFMDVAFADSRRGFAVGLHPAAFQTDNGGASWRPLTLPGHRPHDWLVSVRFSDPQHGWIVGFNDGQQLRSLEGQDGTIVYRTTNGGLDWKRMGGEVKVCATDIWFEDADHGFLCGEQRDGPEVGVIYESKDAGEHWTKVPLELKGIPRCLNQGLGCTDQGEILRLRK